MKSYTDTLRIAPISQPSDPNNYKITVIPDTQGNTYSDRIFSRAANDSSSLIVHLGDITDGATQQEYDDAKKYVDTLNKPCFVLAGNHEAFNGNLDLYYKTFGSPTYHFQYGNSLIVVLNSAYGQSVSSSDSTQYHYLQEILKENKLPNVYVFNHVVTRDAFSTEHNMSASEAQQFEGILSSYKKKNPSSNVNVIFGHLHTLYNWKVDGVNYIIGGNAAGKGYVTAEEGNMLGTGMITVSDGTAQYGFDPLLTKIYIKNDALIGNTLKTFEGAKVQLNLYGDFREYPSNYLTQLNSHELVNITWTSSDPQIATVDKNGVITANGIGQTEVTAVSGGKTSKIILETLDPSKVDAAKIELSLPAKINVGKTILPTVKATDPYGTVFALNNKDVQFTFKNNLMSKQKDSTLLAIKAGMESVTAEFKGKRAAASVQIGELNPSEADVASIQLKLPEKVDVGKTVVPVVKATDPYGNIFELDNRNVQFLFQNGLMNTPKDGTLVASRAGKETVTAAFKGKKSVAQIEILSVSDDSGSSKHSNESRGASKTTESTTPSTVVTSTNQMGGTVTTVSTQPDITPVVTGNKSNVTVTVPADVADVMSAATKDKPAEVKISVPTASLVEQLKNTAVTTVDLTVSVPPVVANNTNANAKVSINVEPAVLQAAKDAKKDITVEVVNSATGKTAYSWTFTGANLTNSAASLTNVNLAITVEPAKNDTAAAVVTAVNTSDRKPAGLVLNFAHSGLLPATASVRVYVGNQPGVTPYSKMYIYYLNKITNTLEQLPQCEFTVDAQGYVTVSVAHCSEYVLLPKPATNAYAIKSDTWTTVGIKSGKTYTYAMTVSGNAAPSFTVGNGKTFALTVERFGSKYYVTVRATGAAGTMTAVYSTLPKQKPVIMGYAAVAK
ncbi:MAG TPA: metallophosphoesterase [Caproiciproducens sp.]|nr:metallophosphoesterase [Caproiciproducens sp.]